MRTHNRRYAGGVSSAPGYRPPPIARPLGSELAWFPSNCHLLIGEAALGRRSGQSGVMDFNASVIFQVDLGESSGASAYCTRDSRRENEGASGSPWGLEDTGRDITRARRAAEYDGNSHSHAGQRLLRGVTPPPCAGIKVHQVHTPLRGPETLYFNVSWWPRRPGRSPGSDARSGCNLRSRIA